MAITRTKITIVILFAYISIFLSVEMNGHTIFQHNYMFMLLKRKQDIK